MNYGFMDDVYDDFDEDYEPELDDWEMLATKRVPDSDGFDTDYTLYTDGERWVTVFGDNELYLPTDGWFDMEFDSEEEARDWFDSYNGFEDDEDDDDIYSAKKIKKSPIKGSFIPAGKKNVFLNTAKIGAVLADKLDAYIDQLDKLHKDEVPIEDYISTTEIQMIQEIPDLLRDIYKSVKTDLGSAQ